MASRATGLRKPGRSWPRIALQGLRSVLAFLPLGILEHASPDSISHLSEYLSLPTCLWDFFFNFLLSPLLAPSNGVLFVSFPK